MNTAHEVISLFKTGLVVGFAVTTIWTMMQPLAVWVLA